jgi:hypothetical protein
MRGAFRRARCWRVFVGPNVKISSLSPLAAIIPFLYFLSLTISITRLGLLAGISFFFVFGLEIEAPLTFDFSRWYAPYSAATLVLVLLLALFAFKTALGSRKLFRTDLFED